MKSSNRLPNKTVCHWAGIALVVAIIGVGCASEQTYQHDDSTAIIRQSGGSGPSESQVIRHEDGHTIITRDGRNTDITIQRRGPAPPGEAGPVNGEERFGKW